MAGEEVNQADIAQSLLICAGIAESKARSLSLLLQSGYCPPDKDAVIRRLLRERHIARASRKAAESVMGGKA